MSDTEILAPIAGEVRQRLVSMGEAVKEKTPLFHLVMTDPLKFQGMVPERFAPEIKIEQPVDLQVEAFADRMFPGVVLRVSPAVDVQTRSLALETKLPNTHGHAQTWILCQRTNLTGVDPQAVFAPEEAVYTYVGITKPLSYRMALSRSGNKTWCAENGRLRSLKGCRSGEIVATSNLAQLYQGAKIRVGMGKKANDVMRKT